jgi:heme ABC exporter ATP-binding subunit CcmA
VSAIEVSDLEKRYGKARALRGLSAALPAASAVLVAGPNGAGKSTLLRILAGLCRPSRGKVAVLGIDPFGAQRNALRSRVGYLGPEAGVYADLSVRENLRFTARLHGVAEARIEACLAEHGLEDVAEQRVSALSFGYRRRAGLARALLCNPEVLLLDEPWNGLDDAAAQRLADVLARSQQAGRTLLVAAHAPAHAYLFDSALRLASGELVALERGAGPIA